MQISEIMTSNVQTVTPDTDLVTVAKYMKDLDVGVIPVVEGEQLVGLITDRDIVIRAVAMGKQAKEVQVREHMSPSPTTVSPNDNVNQAAEIMAREQIRRLPVVENGKLVGIVSIGDVAVDARKDKLTGDALEQISEPSRPRSSEVGR
ncbi:MAG: CBS domain-containing protein [Chloroflexi bacterium]|nr:CBS domain-containing protein [Chloroflexota bacterium]